MFKKRISKITFVLACIIALLMPYTTPVLAAALKHTDTTADLQVLLMHKGGDESSGTLTEAQRALYDITPYEYKVGDTKIFKIITKGDTDYENVFYCLNAKKTFPGVTATGFNSLTYTNVADLKDSADSNVKSLHLSTSYNEDSETWTKNYKALIWLVDNIFTVNAANQKDAYLAKAFEGSEFDVERVKALLTDDDIDVVQQYAMWYFTNNDSEEFSKEDLLTISLTKHELVDGEQVTTSGEYTDLFGADDRQLMAEHLFKYLIIEAQKEAETVKLTYPEFTDVRPQVTTTDDYYVVGPFHVKSGNVLPADYKLVVKDQDENEIPREQYQIKIDGEEEFTNKNVKEIFDQNYYIYLPKTNKTITKVALHLDYTKYETQATLWKNNSTDENGVEVYQPVVLITKDGTPFNQDVSAEINRDEADLALRKYIVQVNDKKLERQPVVDVTGLKEGTSKTATYKHAKAPVKVTNGDRIIYEIRVYNEADIDANGTVIVDALPAGLEFVADSEINKTYNWQIASTVGENNVVYSTDYLKNTTIEGFDKENDETLSSAYVQIECKVSNSARASVVLTNIAEIREDGVDDRDSTPGNNDYINKDHDSSNYTGDNSNKSDLTDSDYHYKGREDDDDFEKVEVEGKAFDLSLQKFISKVNKEAPSVSREPVVDVNPLKEGKTDAKYTTYKTPLVVEKGDIIIYTLRVYNEGEMAGYAESVSDYLPEGLGFLVNHTVNVDNYWAIPEDSKDAVKLSTLPEAKANLSVDDFNGITKLDDVDVIAGKVKLTSTKLKSSATDTKNLIEGFDKENSSYLKYKDIQIACVVLADEVVGDNCRNIAEIVDDSDINREEVDDRDSTPDTVNPDDYPASDKEQDDNDYENLATVKKEFDLSLQKFITSVNSNKLTNREPKLTKTAEGKITFAEVTDPVSVQNNDLITYTIRVYNEGTEAGYAEEIMDDLPDGLEFVKDNETNKKYGWKLYDKNGKETTDLNQAVSVRTDYLSKEKSEARGDDCLLEAFDKTQSVDKVDYRDVQIVFKIVESEVKSSDRVIVNIAEITEDADENGDPVDDVDSTPDNKKENEDDQDDEKVDVKYFDLSLKKDLVKIIVTENGTTREIVINTDQLQKVEIHRKRIDSTVVKFVYNITVKNEGEIAGYATEIKDYIPEGLEFIPEENTQWKKGTDNTITTNALAEKLLKPGESASVQVTLKWINNEENFGVKTNVAEISKDKNDSNTPDIDSTPDNKIKEEDDIDDAPVMLVVSTGIAPTYIGLTTTVIAILATGIILIKKYVLD